MAYLYTPLTASRRDIRILELLPGTDDKATSLENSQIQCKISVVSLNESPRYEALSYVWGSEENKLSIIIDGYAFPVTQNLKQALRHLRHESESVQMWVDAICINQQDSSEKSWQLGMMGNIYEQANSVQAFLGPLQKSSRDSVARLIQIGQEAFDIGLSNLTLKDLARGIEPSEGDPHSEIKGAFVTMSKKVAEDLPMPAWDELASSPYWNRLWVYQEFCLGQHLLIYLGDQKFPFPVFSALYRFLDMHMLRVLTPLRPDKLVTSLDTSSMQDSLVGLRSESEKWHALMAAFDFPARMAIANSIGGRHWRQSHKTGITLQQLLERCCMVSKGASARGAKYPRDLIYGLLGLASDRNRLNIIPNYENIDSKQETAEIFLDCTRRLLTDGQAGNADLLAWCQSPKSLPGLPSWTPDFTVIRYPVCESTDSALFSASGNTKLHVEPVVDDTQAISIRGIRLDMIKSLGTLWDPDSCDNSTSERLKDKSLRDLLIVVEQFCQESAVIYAGPTSRDIKRWNDEAHWQIPCADQCQEGNSGRTRTSSTAKGKKGYEDLRNGFTLYEIANNITVPDLPLQVDGQSTYEYHESFSQMYKDFEARLKDTLAGYQASLSPERNAYSRAVDYLHNRRPFLSELGYVGLAPGEAKIGDLVVVFYGAIQPFVLTESKRKGGFELVGEAYVHEIMDGELLEVGAKEEDFILR